MPAPRVTRSGDLVFRQESLETWSEAKGLIMANIKEMYLPELPCDPDYQKYKQMEAVGWVRVFTMRKIADLKLMGYGLFFVMPHMHFPSMQWAMQDALWVHPGCRGRGAWRFIADQDERLKEMHADVVYRHVGAVDYSRLLVEKLGYVAAERAYIKILR